MNKTNHKLNEDKQMTNEEKKLTKFAEEELQIIWEEARKDGIPFSNQVITKEWLLFNHLCVDDDSHCDKDICPLTMDNYHKVNWHYLEKKYKNFICLPFMYEWK